MGKRQTFVLLAILSGFLLTTGTGSAILAYIGSELGQRFVLISGGMAVALILAGLILAYYVLKEIR